MAIAFFRIRQKSLLDRFRRINDALKVHSNKVKNVDNNILPKLWGGNQVTNKRVNQLCVNIEDYAQFWKASLTIVFIGYITMLCYLLYIVAFVGSTPLAMRMFLLILLVNFVVALFGLIDQSARMDRLNGQIEQVNREFFHLYKNANGFTLSNSKHCVLKVSKVLPILYRQSSQFYIQTGRIVANVLSPPPIFIPSL